MNKVVIIGRLTRDPELLFAAGTGTAVSKFTVAVNRFKKKENQRAETDFINCVAFGKRAEIISQYFIKGGNIAISGEIQTSSYEDKSGIKKYTTDVVVNGFEFLGGKYNNDNTLNDVNLEEGITPVNDVDMPF